MKGTMLSVKEVAPELGVGVQSIRRRYWRGEILVYRINKMLRFDLTRVQSVFLAKGLSTIVRPRAARSPALAGDALSGFAPVR
jgi:hypothetical protein